MSAPTVLVSGASIAGPAVAYWLHRYGFDVTVVEQAPSVRPGGQPVDFKGPVHETVLRRMGIDEQVRSLHVPNGDGAIVDARGHRIGTVPGAFGGGEINVPRGDLARTLYDATSGTCEYLFGTSVEALHDTGGGVEVTLSDGTSRHVDLVVGADGLHSTVRRLALGPESSFVRHLGYHYALADLDAGDEDVMYNEPGRMVALSGGEAPAFFVFAADPLPPARDDVPRQKEQLMAAFAGGRWRLPELVARIPDSTQFYLDSISRATLDRYTTGGVALVGDAAYGNALGGYGTGLALVGAYVLAGELALAGGDPGRAFPAYENAIRPYASVSQKVNAGRLLAPRTRAGIVARNLLFSTLSLASPLIGLVERPARTIELRDYPALVAA